jgi:lipopolysaccharide export system permease protein
VLRRSFIAEANQRILIPLSTFSFALIPLACLLPGELNRRGYAKRVALAVGAAFLFQLIALGVDDLGNRYAAAIPLMYVVDLMPFLLGLGILLHGGIRAGFRWPGLAGGSTS